jgi:hypothetical protein
MKQTKAPQVVFKKGKTYASTKGRIWHRNYITKGGLCGGYRKVKLKIRKYGVHQIVIYTFKGAPPTEKHTPDHIDSNPENNNLENLVYLTQREQVRRSFARQDRKKSGEAMSKPVEYRERKDGHNAPWKCCSSATALGKLLAMAQSSVTRYCLGKRTSSTYEFRYAEIHVPLLGEIWKPVIINKKDTGWKVSNCGRTKSTRGVVGYGCRNGLCYCHAGIGRVNVGVHQLVACAFIGPQPTPQHTVDHIDGNPSNNHVSNLRWATPKEQAKNRKVSEMDRGERRFFAKVITAIDAAESWVECLSIKDGAEKLNIKHYTIRRCLNGARDHGEGYVFKLAEPLALPGEEWKEVPESFFKTVKAEKLLCIKS